MGFITGGGRRRFGKYPAGNISFFWIRHVWIFLLTVLTVAFITLIPCSIFSTTTHTLGLLVGMSGIGDQSFNDMTYAGLIRAKQEYGLRLIYEDSEKTEADFEESMKRLIDNGATIIVANDYYFKALVEKYARKYPDRYFILQEGRVTGLPNVVSIVYAMDEGSFLVGALAGLMTQAKNVGFIGGVDTNVIRVFHRGFKQGVQYINPDIGISVRFLSVEPDFSGFRNPEAGFKAAMDMYTDGVDIIFVAAGLTGNGVLQAAKQAGKYAIGVDSDQDHLVPGHVLTSMMKRLDYATYWEVRKILTGDFTAGVKIYGLKENSVGLSEMKYTRDRIPRSVLDRVSKIRQMIIAGRIKVDEAVEKGDTDSGTTGE